VIYVLSVSGGKDSVGMWAWAKRTGIAPRIQLACDTGWEYRGWRTYLDDVSRRLGEPVIIVSAETPFAARVLKHNTFPGQVNRRWCTQELKTVPFRAYLDQIRADTGEDVTVVVGVRADESAARARMQEREWSDFYDCEVWRPILAWSLEQVIAEHHAAGVPLNPLYLLGAERVGCWPCIKAGKAELDLLRRIDPERIEEIRQLEAATGTTMFTIEAPPQKCPACAGSGQVDQPPTIQGPPNRVSCSDCGGRGRLRKLVPVSIDEKLTWARTERGGKRLAMFPEPTGCARWGLCEAPVRGGE